MAGTGLLMAYHWLRKERTEAKTLLIVLGAGLAVALPYVIGSLLFKRLPGHADALARLGLQHGRSALTLLPSAAFIAFLFVFNKLLRKHHGAPVRFLNAFFIGNLILYNQHIITGVQLQTWHWLTQTGRPWLVLMLLFLAATLLFRKEARWTRGAFIALIALAAAWSLWANAGVAMHLAPAYSVDRPYAEAFAWLDANTPPDSVVLSPDATISTNIPVRTHNTAYVPNGFDTAAPNCELIYRWIAALKLFNASRERVEQLLAANATSMLNPISFMFHVGPSPSPQTLAAIYGTTDFWPYDIAQYQIDYIIVGEKERSLGTLTTDIPTERIYSEDGVDIYRVNLGKPERPSPLQERLCGQETI
jgi:hypothetical protein